MMGQQCYLKKDKANLGHLLLLFEQKYSGKMQKI